MHCITFQQGFQQVAFSVSVSNLTTMTDVLSKYDYLACCSLITFFHLHFLCHCLLRCFHVFRYNVIYPN